MKLSSNKALADQAVAWWTAADPATLLSLLGKQATGRKLRLFCVACARRALPELDRALVEPIIEAAEAFADGGSSVAAMDLHYEQAHEAVVRGMWEEDRLLVPSCRRVPVCLAVDWPNGALRATDWEPIRDLPECAARALGWHGLRCSYESAEYHEAVAREQRMQAELLRDVFPPPDWQPVIDARWRTWNDSTVSRIAQAIYAARSFENLGILGDALADAGCTDDVMLGHCRERNLHVRGCWLIDLLLNRT